MKNTTTPQRRVNLSQFDLPVSTGAMRKGMRVNTTPQTQTRDPYKSLHITHTPEAIERREQARKAVEEERYFIPPAYTWCENI